MKTDQEIIQLALQRIQAEFSTFSQKYPQLNTHQEKLSKVLQPIGVIHIPVLPNKPSVADKFKEKFSIEFDAERHVSVLVPQKILGSQTYVVFELV